ncbi:MAG: D-alanyl-D-alanine carboxypeptidase/D-alanyl-D-alanine-endopeptidase [Syntrophobacteraceae bacterium]|nr:D-alanyl-D-alanine carboxypeptidase/D-alanyl-D-alanine-endopeptidase [Syntrophobacteraceae bacterium]
MARPALNPKLPLTFLILAIVMRGISAEAAPWDRLQDQFLGKALQAADSVGVEVVALPSGQVHWSHRALEPLIPASLLKIATSYAALKTLGPNHRFRTALHAAAAPRGGTLSGDIWLKSEGDIFWTVDRAATLATQLRAKGIETVRGRVLVDNSYFSPPSERVCLDEGCEDSYNPSISSSAIEFNTVLLRVSPSASVGKPPRVEWLPRGRFVQVINEARTAPNKAKSTLGVQLLEPDPRGNMRFRLSGKLPMSPAAVVEKRYSVPNPSAFLAAVFTSVLESSGIRVEPGTTRAVPPKAMPAEAKVLAEDLSPTLAETIHGLNRHSNNFMAEMLLRSLGASALGPPGTEAKGIAAVNTVLQSLGATTAACVLKTGSGLSRECRMSPRALSRILVSACSDPTSGPVFMESLAVNGEEGTLRRRLSRSAVTIRGKTGTLRDVVGFAGYVSSPDRPSYGVVILLNGVRDLRKAKEAMDSFLEDLALSGPSPT